MLPIAVVIHHLPAARFDASDQALTRLDAALADPSDKKAWFVQFEKRCPPADIPAWQGMQLRGRLTNKHAIEVAFALAYYGVDYDVNLRRFYRFDTLYRTSDSGEGKTNSSLLNPDDMWRPGWGQTWVALNLLYLKRHDIASLRLWLDHPVDGGPAEACDEELGDLWRRHKTDMLHAVSGSESRTTRLGDVLYYKNSDDATQWHALLKELDTVIHSGDSIAATSAVAVKRAAVAARGRATQNR